MKYLKHNDWVDAGIFDGNNDFIVKAGRNVDFITKSVRIYPIEFHEAIELRADIIIDTKPCLVTTKDDSITQSMKLE